MPPKVKGGKSKTEYVGSKRQGITINEIKENSLVIIPEDAQEEERGCFVDKNIPRAAVLSIITQLDFEHELANKIIQITDTCNHEILNILKGFQERIETGIQWTLIELAARHHREMCSREDIPEVTFKKAFQCCLRKSILKYFFHKKTGLSYDEQYCFNLPITVWDVIMFGTEEQIFLFNCANSLTDDLFKIIKKVAPLHSVKVLEKELKTVHILRVLDCEMTHFDTTLLEFNNLKFLNLCGNYIKDVDPQCLPLGLEALELQANGISHIGDFAKSLPPCLAYLGLSRNLLTNDGLYGISHLSHNIGVLDLSDNDILELDRLLHGINRLPLCSLTLAGNPCAMCIGYVSEVKKSLPSLKYLDGNEIDRPEIDVHQSAEGSGRTETDLLYTYFQFSVLRIMTVPVPPKTGPKEIAAFHVEVELPLLDKVRRNFLMFGANESLSISLPPPEVEELSLEEQEITMMSKSMVLEEQQPIFNIYDYLAPVNLSKIRNYTIFESNKNNRWDNIMYFQEPALKIMCPDLKAIRDTFRTKVIVRLVYSVTYPPPHHGKSKHKVHSPTEKQMEGEYRVTLATITCDLRRVDWKFPMQEFAWDETMPTNEAQLQEGNSLSVHHEQNDGEGVETEMGRKKMKRWTMPDVPRWWQAKIIEYAFSHPHVRSRLEKHMGTNLVLLTDKAYMNELEDRIHEINDDNLNRRIAARVMDEMERLKKLILIGKTPLKECPPELYHHPVFVFWRQVNREVAKECKKRYLAYLRKLKTSQKIDFMLDEAVVEEGEEEEERKLTPEEILQKCREELEEQKQEDLNNGFRFTDADFDLYKYETNDIKTLKSLSTVDELYTLADKIIGTKRL